MPLNRHYNFINIEIVLRTLLTLAQQHAKELFLISSIGFFANLKINCKKSKKLQEQFLFWTKLDPKNIHSLLNIY
jgi:choline kinase